MRKKAGFMYSPGLGKWVEVGDPIEGDAPTKPAARRRRVETAYAQVGLKEAATAFEALGVKKAFVWLWLQYLAWKKKSTTFPLPNGELEQFGISRWTKSRALQDLTQAGLITVRQVGKEAVTVTVHVGAKS